MNLSAKEQQPSMPANLAGDALEVARSWLEQHGKVALATVASTWGSAPVSVGGQMVVGPQDRFHGSVSGGCVESEVIAEAADALVSGASKLLAFGVDEETAWRAGLPCGGKIEVLLEPLERARDAGTLERISVARRERRSVSVVTDLATGARSLATAEGASPEVAECLALGESRLIQTPEGWLFVHALTPPMRILIAGATHVGQILAGLACQAGYDVAVIDPRSTFASAERFHATEVLAGWPEPSLATAGIDARTAVVAVAHASHIDDEALTAALRSPCLYVGALGSRRTHAKRIERLKSTGFSDAELGRIHAPVGLAIGAKGPAEIAVSILAEIIKVVRGA
jgi:xanthine dehydrogenase accessory factor